MAAKHHTGAERGVTTAMECQTPISHIPLCSLNADFPTAEIFKNAGVYCKRRANQKEAVWESR